jgi:hypothetical protein
MAQWQYATLCTELTVALTLTTNCETLQDYGMNGWELVQGATTKKRCLAIWSLRMKDRCIRVSNPRALNAGGRGGNRTGVLTYHTRHAAPRVVRRPWWRCRQILIAAGACWDDICTEDSLRKEIDYDQA